MKWIVSGICVVGVIARLVIAVDEGTPRESVPSSVEEARARAILLHDTMETMLHEVHREYYREDENLMLPAAAIKSVFRGLGKRHHVRFRWLAVEGQAMNVEHEASTEFEKEAVRALSGGEAAYERVGDGEYQRAGRITLTSECLKCHVPNRKSTEDRAAGLIISLPLEKGS